MQNSSPALGERLPSMDKLVLMRDFLDGKTVKTDPQTLQGHFAELSSILMELANEPEIYGLLLIDAVIAPLIEAKQAFEDQEQK